MQLLKELLLLPTTPSAHEKKRTAVVRNDKYVNDMVESVDDVVANATDKEFVDLPTPPAAEGKKRKKRFPTTDKAENSLINTLWYYQNADAS